MVKTPAQEKQKEKSLSNREKVLVDRRGKNVVIAGLSRGLHKFGLKIVEFWGDHH